MMAHRLQIVRLDKSVRIRGQQYGRVVRASFLKRPKSCVKADSPCETHPALRGQLKSLRRRVNQCQPKSRGPCGAPQHPAQQLEGLPVIVDVLGAGHAWRAVVDHHHNQCALQFPRGVRSQAAKGFENGGAFRERGNHHRAVDALDVLAFDMPGSHDRAFAKVRRHLVHRESPTGISRPVAILAQMPTV